MTATTETAEDLLGTLCDKFGEIKEKGFAVDLRAEPAAWKRAVSALGPRRAYRLMSERLCAAYERRFGRPFLFSEECVAFEIAYHAEAYFWALGYGGKRHVSTLLFSREELARHCEIIDISTDDVAVAKQRLMFSYAAGIRSCYRGTAADPFHHKGPPQD